MTVRSFAVKQSNVRSILSLKSASVEMATIFVGKIFDTTERLQKFPFSGRVIPEIMDSDCREIIYGAYRIMYRIEHEEVWITGVMHGARDWKTE